MENTAPDLLQEFDDELNFRRASTGTRFANHLIDTICFWVLVYLLNAVGLYPYIRHTYQSLQDMQDYRFLARLENGLVDVVLLVLFYTVIEGATKGKTLGKVVTLTKVVKENGQPIEWKDAFRRSLSRIVPFEPLSTFGGFPWHDRWTRTVVIKDPHQA
jgi:uncharacterized RDD family membrane protein YckC